jgi:hypothetical protein
MKKILSIDGGGIRGIIPGQVLIALEQKLQEKTGKPDARIAEYFDFFAGTSTGGILTCILLCPSTDGSGRPRFSAKQAVELYIKYGNSIFQTGFWHRLFSLNGIAHEKYEADNLEHYLAGYFRGVKLNQLLKPCIIAAYDIERRKTIFFAQHNYAQKGDAANFWVKDVCRATSAAPTYFEPELLKSLSGVSYACIDGGLFANNPAICAYAEVRKSEGGPTAKDMFIVSMGTGSEDQCYPYHKAKDWGAIGWVKPVINVMMSGAAEITNYHMAEIFSAYGNQSNYIRIQPSGFINANPKMDDASPSNIKALIELGIETAESCMELNRIVDVLLQGNDDVLYTPVK